MGAKKALLALAEVTASQWGMVTAAQASELGVTRLMLSRLVDAGHLERLAHGVYRDAGAPSDQFEELRVAWLSTEPKLRAEERIKAPASGVVVASASAALLHGVGDLWADRHEFVTPKRRQTQRAEIRYRQRQLEASDVTIVGGLPTMTLERTLADLLEDVGEMSLVADALGGAAKKRSLDLERLATLLSPLAERNGFKRNDGEGVLGHLLEMQGLDLDSIAARVSSDELLGARVVRNYLRHALANADGLGAARFMLAVNSLGKDFSVAAVQRIVDMLGQEPTTDHGDIAKFDIPSILASSWASSSSRNANLTSDSLKQIEMNRKLLHSLSGVDPQSLSHQNQEG